MQNCTGSGAGCTFQLSCGSTCSRICSDATLQQQQQQRDHCVTGRVFGNSGRAVAGPLVAPAASCPPPPSAC
eukprot:m.232647 g.232647  ORF g.232647 m.232647 type:complete len:72 (+) comp10875_c0_seq88:251-466(+)